MSGRAAVLATARAIAPPAVARASSAGPWPPARTSLSAVSRALSSSSASRFDRPPSTWRGRRGGITATGRPTSPSSTPRRSGDRPASWPPIWRGAFGRTRPSPPGRRSRWPGPGFVNFHLSPGWLHDTLAEVVTEGEAGVRAQAIGHGERVQVEFISANPTGPLHVGNGWWGAYGDALGRVMARCGWRVDREYYVNDTGGQIRSPRGEPAWPAAAARPSPRPGTRAST